nr:uncharacterized protein LOC105463192 [Macaca nemestrina]
MLSVKFSSCVSIEPYLCSGHTFLETARSYNILIPGCAIYPCICVPYSSFHSPNSICFPYLFIQVSCHTAFAEDGIVCTSSDPHGLASLSDAGSLLCLCHYCDDGSVQVHADCSLTPTPHVSTSSHRFCIQMKCQKDPMMQPGNVGQLFFNQWARGMAGRHQESCLWPASVKLWQANLSACKLGKNLRPFTILNVVFLDRILKEAFVRR